MKLKIKSTGQFCYMYDNSVSGEHAKVLIPFKVPNSKGELGEIATVKSSNLQEVKNFS